MTDKPLFSDLNVTHEHEEKLRAESLALIHADEELSRRLMVIEKAMTLIFGYTIEHTSRSANEATVQLLGIRLFNAAASGVKLALAGYYQTGFQQARDIMETGFLLDFFRTSPEQIAAWRAADRAIRRSLFEPVKIREALDKRDGDTRMRRAAQLAPLRKIDRASASCNLALADPKMTARLTDLGVVPMPMTPAEFGKLIADETEKWGKVIQAAHIKVD